MTAFDWMGDTDTPAWMDNAHCRNHPDPYTVWFPTKQGDRADVVAAEACAPCPVAVDCLEYALDRNIGHGIWGGRTEEQRRRLLRQRRRDRDRQRRQDTT